MTFCLGASKTDQQGLGRVVALPFGKRARTCPVRNLRAWLEARGRWRGPLFYPVRGGPVERSRLGGRAICTVVQQLLRSIGKDSSGYGDHSLRAGMATSAAESGASEISIKQRGSWKSMAAVQRYVRPSQGFRADRWLEFSEDAA